MECQAITYTSQETSKHISIAMLSVPASTQSREITSPAYKSMASANSSLAPSTAVTTIHDAPRMSSTSQHNEAIGSGNDVERDREIVLRH